MSDAQAQEAARLAEMIRVAMPDSYTPQPISDDDARTIVLAQEHLGTANVAAAGVASILAFANALLRSQAARIAELESRVHTCGPTCSKAGCINRRLAAEVEALRAELDAHRLYARQLCKAIDAATDFAGTVAGGASWWDDVWAKHHSALDRAREGISAAIAQLKE